MTTSNKKWLGEQVLCKSTLTTLPTQFYLLKGIMSLIYNVLNVEWNHKLPAKYTVLHHVLCVKQHSVRNIQVINSQQR